MKASLHQWFLFVASLTHSPYLHLLTIPVFLFNNHLLASPRVVFIFQDGFKLFMPPKQSAVGLIWPYLTLSVELNLSSAVNTGKSPQSQEHEFHFQAFLSLPGHGRDLGSLTSDLTYIGCVSTPLCVAFFQK